MKKIIVRMLMLLAAVVGLVAAWFFWQIQRTVTLDRPVVITITEGMGASEIAIELKARGVISSSSALQFYALLDGSYSELSAGTYRFESGVNTIQVVRDLSTGAATVREVTVQIPEGWNKYQIAEHVDQDLGLYPAEEMLVAMETMDSRLILPEKTYVFLRSKPKDQGLEGYVFPDTYRVFIDGQPKDLIEKALDNFDDKYNPGFRQVTADRGLSVHQAVTLASIVEEEVRTFSDKKIVAGVLLKRLKLNMPLQVDSTINYITRKQVLRASNEDLAVDSPYNTYKYRGLPPGPISNPGLESIEAVLYPTETDYLYFITGPNLEVHYSETFEEHVQKKNELYP